MNRFVSLTGCTLLSAMTLAGCAAGKFTHERFSMIREGVDNREDVRQLLGEPRFPAGDEWFYEAEDHGIVARVFFDAQGVVRGKEWIDAGSGEWEGQHPDADKPPEGEVRERRTKTRRIDDD